MINLSDRLKTIYGLIEPGETVADVGTDAGLLPAALLEGGRSPFVLMTDISQGSLDKCRDFIAKNLPPEFTEGTHYELRRGDGLKVLSPSEVDTVVMAGIGGMLSIDILSDDLDLSHSFRRIILQPRRHVGRLRYWLWNNDFHIIREDLAREGRFIWPIITVEHGLRACFVNQDPDDIENEYPLTLLKYKNNLTGEYLENALRLEKEKLASKAGSKLTPELELRTQEHRVSRLEYLISRL
ncbi:MAG: SAM-dependent methyltransferase [Firmicutes bacterium]|nr:SAM-dependent methyltransferase [Bacillota bacterium]